MPRLRKPLYQRGEGADEDRWCLVFDIDVNRLFVEHEETRGDGRGSGYGARTEAIEVTAFLKEGGQGQHRLAQLLGSLFEQRDETPRSAAGR
jgi:hypothetical protein